MRILYEESLRSQQPPQFLPVLTGRQVQCLDSQRSEWYQTFRETLVTLVLEASLVQPMLFRQPASGVVMEARHGSVTEGECGGCA